jgi:hypothetical protein
VAKINFPDIKLSVIITILDSYFIVARYLRHFKRMDLPSDIEIILMDDGSKRSLKSLFQYHDVKNLNIYPTGDYRPWTQACARNLAAKIALGENLLMTDIDHILTKEAILASRDFAGDKMTFHRYFAILDRNGKIRQKPRELFRWGLNRRYKGKDKFPAGKHTNTFAMKKSLYMKLDGYHPRYCGIAQGSNHGDKRFYKKYADCVKKGICKEPVNGPDILVFPGMAKCETIEEIDPLNLFHGLKRG